MNIETLTAVTILKQLKAGLISPLTLVDHLFDRIKKRNHLNAFISICEEYAMDRAKESFDLIASGQARPLEGLPISVKDMFCTHGIRTTAGSKILENFIPPYTATVVKRLENAGAIIVGKNNQDEFAMGSGNEYSAYGAVLNPHNEACVAGGSSGGSAAAVADFLSYASLGTDTGGSVRLPASFCGIVGFKPTYGAFSRFGVISFASSFDHPGIFARSVSDVRLLAKIMGGKCDLDSTSIQVSFESNPRPFASLKFAFIKEQLDAVSPEVKANFMDIVKLIQSKGASVQEIEFPEIVNLIKMYYLITPTEAYSNLLKYDGIRLGTYIKGHSVEDSYLKTRALFGLEVTKRILLGVDTLTHRRPELDYAIQCRRKLIAAFHEFYNEVDAFIYPTTTNIAFKRHSLTSEADGYALDMLTVLANMIKAPAISVPSGVAYNMPLGLTIMCNASHDAQALDIAEAVEAFLKEENL